MIIKFDKKNPLTVTDFDNNVLFDWQPEERLRNTTELRMKPMSDEDRKYIIEQLKNAGFNKF